jgi:hypothetical protein
MLKAITIGKKLDLLDLAEEDFDLENLAANPLLKPKMLKAITIGKKLDLLDLNEEDLDLENLSEEEMLELMELKKDVSTASNAYDDYMKRYESITDSKGNTKSQYRDMPNKPIRETTFTKDGKQSGYLPSGPKTS